MQDKFGRNINYLRVSVTDRCDLRCKYCIPHQNIAWLRHEDVLSLEEIVEVVRVAVDLGINKVRLTGGEPLQRRGIVHLVRMLSDISGIDDLSMTTNGISLAEYAKSLFDVGLQRINISLDTLNADKFRELTGGGDLTRVLNGIDAALDSGLYPVKLNCVVKNSSKEYDAQTVKKFAAEKGIEVRFIHLMNFKTGAFSIVEGGQGGNCQQCNRLRLLSDGTVRPCLFSDSGFSVRIFGIKDALIQAIADKPKFGGVCQDQAMMSRIGG